MLAVCQLILYYYPITNIYCLLYTNYVSYTNAISKLELRLVCRVDHILRP